MSTERTALGQRWREAQKRADEYRRAHGIMMGYITGAGEPDDIPEVTLDEMVEWGRLQDKADRLGKRALSAGTG